MSDMLGSIVGSVFGGRMQDTPQGIATQKSKAELGQSFMDALVEADKRVNVSVATAGPKEVTAAEKFMKYQEMTPAEKFRASYLAEKGLTEEDLQKMSAEDRIKIEEEIAQRIKEKMAEGVRKKLSGES